VTAEVKSVLVHALLNGLTPDRDYPAELTTHFGFRAQVLIGGSDDDLADSFDIVVCSPSWFAQQVSAGIWDTFQGAAYEGVPDSVAVGAGVWFMRAWERASFDQCLQVLCAAASPGPDWGTVASRIGEYLPWEYAYRHHERVNRQHNLPSPGS
jgi:hypothetical protein